MTEFNKCVEKDLLKFCNGKTNTDVNAEALYADLVKLTRVIGALDKLNNKWRTETPENVDMLKKHVLFILSSVTKNVDYIM